MARGFSTGNDGLPGPLAVHCLRADPYTRKSNHLNVLAVGQRPVSCVNPDSLPASRSEPPNHGQLSWTTKRRDGRFRPSRVPTTFPPDVKKRTSPRTTNRIRGLSGSTHSRVSGRRRLPATRKPLVSGADPAVRSVPDATGCVPYQHLTPGFQRWCRSRTPRPLAGPELSGALHSRRSVPGGS